MSIGNIIKNFNILYYIRRFLHFLIKKIKKKINCTDIGGIVNNENIGNIFKSNNIDQMKDNIINNIINEDNTNNIKDITNDNTNDNTNDAGISDDDIINLHDFKDMIKKYAKKF